MDEEDSDRSSEATHFQILSRNQQQFHHFNNEEFDDDNNQTDFTNDFDTTTPPHMEIDDFSTPFQSETLTSGLAEVPIQYEMRQDELEHLKSQLQGSHQEALAIVIAQAAQAHAHAGNEIQLPGVPSSSSELSPPISIPPRLNSQEEIPSVEETPDNLFITEAEQKLTSNFKTVSTSRAVKTPVDGYNWRKYGQKQVKSPQGSRSYFKCTYSECDAKKIESCDQYNSIIKIVYKGQHKHDPPKKVFAKRGKSFSASSREQERNTMSTPRSMQHKSISPISNGQILVEEMDLPPPKRRVVKKTSSTSPGSVLKPPKKPKFVIHAASDVGISADGYRWRKYGQKMVKGNPHPRNYYKCTSTGCPVRKHIEMAVDGSSEVILTYKGIHDHDMPTRTQEQGPPKVLLLTAVSSPSRNTSQLKKGATEPLNGVAEKRCVELVPILASDKIEV
uniref:probable WRKY transcription factor 32 n=1 Tax=Erigeron canadensis TaxID=72917 RepID=UPI001CB9AD19|nr:probable WRKY transcription factor 32 [Erigeron canadensis]